MTCEKLDVQNAFAMKIFEPLSKDHPGISVWKTPKDLVDIEPVHTSDGIHFSWPSTIGPVSKVRKFGIEWKSSCKIKIRSKYLSAIASLLKVAF
jgi:hypothetical protein